MKQIKAVGSFIFGAISSLVGILAIPVILLAICNVTDYITGLLAAGSKGEKISSYKSIKGITKKVCMWLLVVVGAILDALLAYASHTVGITLPFDFFMACLVAIWLICNELLSILENISDVGVPLPKFLKKVVVFLKKQTESKGDILPEQKEGGKDDDSARG